MSISSKNKFHVNSLLLNLFGKLFVYTFVKDFKHSDKGGEVYDFKCC